jgi:hypothetical protein
MDASDIITPSFDDAIIEATYDTLGHTLDLRQAVTEPRAFRSSDGQIP